MYLRPHSLAEALRLQAARPVLPLAGGTDVWAAAVDRPTPAAILDLSRVAELRGIEASADGLRIAACVTWSTLARAALPGRLAALQEAAAQIGSVQIQNRATLGGNLCNASPAADGVPCLLACDAMVELASTAGTRLLPLDRFILGNRRTARRADELLTAIMIPPPQPREGSAFQKLGARRHLVISIVMVAVRVSLDAAGKVASAAVAVGAASPVACRLHEVERRLVGRDPSDDPGRLLGAEDVSRLAPIDDVRASAAYRSEVVRPLFVRALALAAGRAGDG